MKTTDRGYSWQNIYTGFYNDFLQIQVVTNNYIAIMASEFNYIYTTDAGNTWTVSCLTTTFSPNYLYPSIISFYCLNETMANVRISYVKDVIFNTHEYFTDDGGLTWSTKFPSDDGTIFGTQFISKINFLNDSHGIGVGESGEIDLVKFDSTGFINYQNIVSNMSNNIGSIDSPNGKDFAIIGFNNFDPLMISHDGGNNWDKKNLDNISPIIDSGSVDFYSLSYVSDENIMIIGNRWRDYDEGTITYMIPRGFIERTTDMGKSFSLYLNPIIEGFNDLTMSQINYGVIDAYGDTVLYTLDGGKNWNPIIIDDTISFNLMTTSPEPGVFCVIRYPHSGTSSDCFLLKSTDYGSTWKRFDNPIYGKIYDWKFFDYKNGWCVGGMDTIVDNNKKYINFIAKTTDEGETFEYMYKSDTMSYQSYHIAGFDFADNYNGIFGTDLTYALRTTDGGLSWIKDTIPFLNKSYDNIRSIAYHNKDLAIAVCGMTNKVLRYTPEPDDVPQSEITENKGLIISPNPVLSSINIKVPLQLINQKIKIYSIEGIEVINCDYKENIDVSNLAQGVYFIRIGNLIGKFVKI